MAIASEKERFWFLDGLRGIAAICVSIEHLVFFSTYQLLPNSALAVDFFFLLSGFVIAHAYEARLLTGLKFSHFMKIRLIRLYPLYFLAITTSALLALGGISRFPVEFLGLSYLLHMFLLPTPESLQNNTLHPLFPLNGPAWSLYLELFINFIYAGFIKFLSSIMIYALMFAGLAIFIMQALAFDDSNIGWGSENWVAGFPRVFYSFFCGIIVYRFFARSKKRSIPSFAKWLIPLIMILTFKFGGVYMQLASIALLFPLMVYAGSQVEVAGKTRAFADWLGKISYPLYITHLVSFNLIFAAIDYAGFDRELPSVLFAEFLAIIIAWLLAVVYDIPVRKFLTKKFV